MAKSIMGILHCPRLLLQYIVNIKLTDNFPAKRLDMPHCIRW